MSRQNRTVIFTNHIVTRDRNCARSRSNSHSNRIRSLSRNTTLVVDTLHREVVNAVGREVHRQRCLVLTRNLNTILVPNVARQVGDVSRQRVLLVLANRVSRRGDRQLSRQLGHDNRDAVNSLARTAGGVHRAGHHVSGRNERLYINAACMRTILPCVGHIARPTIFVSIQRNMLAFADSRLGSGNLYLRTEGRNCEVIARHRATFSGCHRNIIDTGSNRLRDTGRTVVPCERTRNIGVSRQNRTVIFANHIVTRNRNCARSRSNGHSNRIRSLSRNTTLVVDTLHREVVNTVGREVHCQRCLVLTRNLNTVLVPNVTSQVGDVSRQRVLLVLANRVSRRGNRQLSRQRGNNNLDAVNAAASATGGIHRAGHHISGRNERLDIDAACM